MKMVLFLMMLAKVIQGNYRSSSHFAHRSASGGVRGLQAAYAAQKRTMDAKFQVTDVYDLRQHGVCRAAKSVNDVCGADGRDAASYAKELNDMAQNKPSKGGLGDLSSFRLGLDQAIQQLPATNESLSQSPTSDSMLRSKAQEILGVWDQISHWSGEHVLALKETWTDTDTKLLLILDSNGGFGNTTEAIRQKLPSIKDLERILYGKRFASVGSGSTLRGGNMGPLIDQHDEVVRFNNLVGDALDPNDTGTKTTVHVVNHFVKGQAGLPVFDLETTCLWASYCQRKWPGGLFRDHDAPLFLLRPSARCAMPIEINRFSRGFLFYWFLGSEVKHMDLYGFQGGVHYHSPKAEDLYTSGDLLLEGYIKFEHLVYKQALEASAKLSQANTPPLHAPLGNEHGALDDHTFLKKHLRDSRKSPPDHHEELSHLVRLASHLQRLAAGSEFMRKVVSFVQRT